MTLPGFPELPADPPKFEIIDTQSRDGALIRDIRFEAPLDAAVAGKIEAYLVEPEILDATAPRPGLLFAHWFDPEAPNGNRTQFIDEAADWARRHRAAAVLPQLTFPWQTGPTGSTADSAHIVAEVTRLRRCLDLLVARPAVDAARIGVVGHDFGGMHAAILATVDRRPAAYALVAAVPRWADWFLPFWPIDQDRIDYLRGMRPLDPIEHVRLAEPARMLFQFAKHDFYIAPMTAREFGRAAGNTAELHEYDGEHDMEVPKARADRTAFLEGALGAR